jgi:hypothetical protein
MSEEAFLNRQRHRVAVEKSTPTVSYTATDFQLEVLDKLAEMQGLAESPRESWSNDLKAVKEQRLLKFDSRTLIALLAIALSIAGYVIQDREKHRQAR